MPKLTEAIKRFIVIELACDSGPSEVAGRVREEFGIEVSRQQVNDYHPERAHKAPVAKKWVTLFEETREKCRKEISDIPIAIKAFRLRELTDIYRRAKRNGNLVLASQTLAQGAKEVGGVFTNQRQITGSDGGPIEHRDVTSLTDEEIEAELQQLLGGD